MRSWAIVFVKDVYKRQACVFILRGELNPRVQKMLLGFASGVMVAASIWSLLIPAMDMSVEWGKLAFLPAVGGFLLGVLFLLLLDWLIPHLHLGSGKNKTPSRKPPTRCV